MNKRQLFIMKHIILFLCSACIFYSCKKDKTDSEPPVNIAINGVADITIDPNGTGQLALEVTGDQKTVNLAVSGLPSTVIAQFSSASGTPVFSTSLTLSASGAASGTYPVTLSGTSGSTVKNYNFNLHVRECVSSVTGSKSGSDLCSSNSYTYDVTVTKASETRVTIRNFGGFGENVSVYADLDCSIKALTVPSQTVGAGRIIEGTGIFDSGKMTITYTVTDVSGDTDNCVVTIE